MSTDLRYRLAEDVMGRLNGRDLAPELASKQCRIVVFLNEDESATAVVYASQGHSRAGGIAEYRIACTRIKRRGRGRPTEFTLASTLLDGGPSPFSSTVTVTPICSCAMGAVGKHTILNGERTSRVRLPEWLEA